MGLIGNILAWILIGFQSRHLFFTPFLICLLVAGIILLKVDGKSKKLQEQVKRPLNVDLTCHLRVIGYGQPSYHFSSDDGDGYTIYPGYMENEGPEIKSFHYEEWAEQLDYLSDWCRKKAQTAQKNKEV